MLLIFTVESYLKFFLKKAPITGDNKYFEILPYPPSDWKDVVKSPPKTGFLGPKNILPEKESVPKIKDFLSRRSMENIFPEAVQPKTTPPVKEEKITIPEKKAHEEVRQKESVSEIKKESAKSIKQEAPLNTKKLPSLEQIIPKTPELIAKMPKEESININTGKVKEGKELLIATKEYKYWSYLDKMKRKIELLWQYPEVARINGLSGSLKINFSIDKTGKLKEVVLIESSGYKFFDDAAMKALRDASPFAPFPDTWDVEKLNIEGTFIYEIKVIR